MSEEANSERLLADVRARKSDPTRADELNTLDDLLRNPTASDLSGLDQAGQHSGDASTSGHNSKCGAFVGRYEIIRQLGQGGFGTVFLARDSELDRLVAIKLPHLEKMKNDRLKQMYLLEAKTLAKLDHPSIVPIYDCGVVQDGRCFVVSKYIAGRDLAKLLSMGRMQVIEVAKLLATVAEALHSVHRAGFVHRDIKPANLLLGDDSRIYVADFGLAVRDEIATSTDTVAGTPSYMSPEQIRREGHRVDGRSDQFSLGVVMYEMLVGERPFKGESSSEVLQQVLKHEPPSPRYCNPRVPTELNRICIKLLSKLASQRYPETIELAHDLRDWLKQAESSSFELHVSNQNLKTTAELLPTPSSSTENKRAIVVPRGLRAFSRNDAYFFLNLLPGVRDRDGLPETISHWKRWVSLRDESPELHRVGVISGPTGCGKSSLVRAGLLPVLESSTSMVLIEASSDLTEKHLRTAIKRNCPLAQDKQEYTLAELLATVRRMESPGEKSLLIVIDQFESWLHAHPDPHDTELVRALRQCDGQNIQCILLVRDDFWLALSRFMEAVEVPLQMGRNAMMVDLFDLRHAKKVLTQFGIGFGQLGQTSDLLTADQERFVDGAVKNLATDGKVIPVHLAIFAEMVKNRTWHPNTLKDLGGAVGVGAKFLNESFSATYAPANQRTHDPSARKILAALVPDLGTEIRARRRTRSELFELSGYTDRAQFDLLMPILEADLKLISAVDSLEHSKSDSSISSSADTAFQLSHDFLVPSIREWLNAKQRESFSGRLHQRLSEQAGLWGKQKDTRFLPNFWEWLLVRATLSQKSLSPIEQSMMVKRDRRSIAMIAIAVCAIIWIYFGSAHLRTESRIRSLIEQLTSAGPELTPKIITELVEYGLRAERSVGLAIAASPEASRERFVLQIAHLHWHGKSVAEVFDESLNSMAPEYVPIISRALKPYTNEIGERCWQIAESYASKEELISNNRHEFDERTFRAVQLLAALDPPTPANSARWQRITETAADLLVHSCAVHPDRFSDLSESLRPLSNELLAPLSRSLSSQTDDGQSRYAISLLSVYTKPESEQRARFSTAAAKWQRELLFPRAHQWSVNALWDVVRESVPVAADTKTQAARLRQRATAAAILLSLPTVDGADELWSLLRKSPNQTVRSCLMEQMHEVGVTASRIVARLKYESDVGIQCGLLLALGDYNPSDNAVSAEVRALIVDHARRAEDPGLHAAAQWLLRHWKEPLPSDSPDAAPPKNRGWLRSPKNLTLIRVDAREEDNIKREYFILDREVTISQFLEFNPREYFSREFGPTDDCPANVVEWREAAAFCNWLSEQEGLTPFYPSDPEVAEKTISSDKDFDAPGYRLPTAAEWQFACRAGTQTPCFFGLDRAVLGRYAWYLKETEKPELNESERPRIVSSPVGMLRPNDLGIFDIFGNVEEWCNDPGEFNAGERKMRGGAASFFEFSISSDLEGSLPPRIQHNSMGFRVVRTIK